MRSVVVALMLAAASLGGCKKHVSQEHVTQGAGNPVLAKEMLGAFLKPGADPVALTNAMRPKPEDYAAVFVGDAGAKVKAVMDPLWDAGKLTLKPPPEATQLDVSGATVEMLQKADGAAHFCPPAYKDIAAQLAPNTVVYCFRFAKPGEKTGALHVDGLVQVNGHWAWFPKPWKALVKSPAAPAGTAAPASSAPAP
jgi:hypothetical protein